MVGMLLSCDGGDEGNTDVRTGPIAIFLHSSGTIDMVEAIKPNKQRHVFERDRMPKSEHGDALAKRSDLPFQ